MAQNSTKIVYVSREIERTLGIVPNANFLIVSNRTPYGEAVQKQYPDFITLIDSPPGKLFSTADLLGQPATAKLLTPGTRLLVFKNTIRVEAAATQNKWQLVNPPALLSERIENKLSQMRWLGPLAQKYLPPHGAKVAKYITWKSDSPIVLQWAHGHTGDSTMLIRTPEDLRAVQEKFPERMARLSTYIEGPAFTVNVVVTPERILMGNVSYQITGVQPFTDNRFSSVGNDWGLASRKMTREDIAAIESIVRDIGAKMQTDGWKGLFGIDLVFDEAKERFYLIEVNARQPASAIFESFLQEKKRDTGVKGLTTFEAHLRALLGQPMDQDLIRIEDGAQIVQHLTKEVQSIFDDVAPKLEKHGYMVVAYQNTAYNSDLLRIQSMESIMESHGSFNARGREITEAIKSSHLKINI